MAVTDQEAWAQYPTLHSYFNKLWVSDMLGYKCGPVGIPIPEDGKYIVRPTYNLNGMSAGANVDYYYKGDLMIGSLGYFWCEFFEGNQYSCDFEWDNAKREWVQGATYLGTKEEKDLSKFTSWKRVSKKLVAPGLASLITHVKRINIEFIEDKPIEIHLRTSPDPMYDELVPIWNDTPKTTVDKLHKDGYSYVESYDNANGFIQVARLGFMVK
jgi:hypothetical protein